MNRLFSFLLFAPSLPCSASPAGEEVEERACSAQQVGKGKSRNPLGIRIHLRLVLLVPHMVREAAIFFLTFFHFVVTSGDEKSLLVVQVAKYFDRSPVNKLEIITSRRFSWRQKMYVFTNNNIYITFDPDIFLI